MIRRGAVVFATALLAAVGAHAETMRVAVTTSFHNSGLSDVLLPAIARDLGLDVRLLVVGTGQALRLGRAGDVDAVLAHSRAAEEAFVAAGFATHRREIMHNDFVLIGPARDPAGIAGAGGAAEALAAIAEAGTPFVSRGDDSGTHKKELALWAAAGIEPSGDWYLETGQGMSATLTVADQRDAYALTDRGTFLSLGNRLQLTVAVEGDARLLNYYSVLTVAEEKGGINAAGAKAWADFIRRPDIQTQIGSYRRAEYGRPLFIPAANDSEQEIAARGGTPRE